jgi:hypothetical protein
MSNHLGVPKPAPPFAGQAIGQIGIVVGDLEAALQRASATWGNGPWRVFTYSPAILAEQVYRGTQTPFSVRIALNAENPQIEFLQPLDGPSIYHEWLAERGEGLHHLAVWVDSLDQAMASMTEAGYEVIQYGKGMGANGDGGFAYYDTQELFGVVSETVERPKVHREPEAIIA